MRVPSLLALSAVLALSVAEAKAGDAAAGEQRYKVNCINCHGRNGQGMASFPPIAGREAAYIVDRLTSYRARERVGPNSAIMMSLARDLTDAEIANLAAYISSTFD
jgi:cytochrome c553